MIGEIINGNCIDVMSGMKGNSVDMVLTDIPYGEVNRHDYGLRCLDKGDADCVTFDLELFISELIRICRGSIYVFCAWEQISVVLSLLKAGWLITSKMLPTRRL